MERLLQTSGPSATPRPSPTAGGWSPGCPAPDQAHPNWGRLSQRSERWRTALAHQGWANPGAAPFSRCWSEATRTRSTSSNSWSRRGCCRWRSGRPPCRRDRPFAPGCGGTCRRAHGATARSPRLSMQVLAMHGWAGQAGTWSHWRQPLKTGAKWSSADRGYSSGERCPAWTQPGPSADRPLPGAAPAPCSCSGGAGRWCTGSFSASCHGRAGHAVAMSKGMQAALGTDRN